MPDEKNTSAAIYKFFGKREGQTMTDFVQEFKQLTEEDKEQLARGIWNGTLNY